MTGERVVVRYAMVFDPLANHACKIVQRADGAYVSYDDYVALRAQVAALAGEKEDAARWRYVRDNGYVTTMTVDLPDKQRVFAGRVGDAYATACVDAMMALDAARGGEG